MSKKPKSYLLTSLERPFTNFKIFIIGVLFSLIPIINLFVTGYGLRCAQRAMKHNFVLPKWEKFGRLFVTGFLSFVIQFLYILPALIILFIAMINSLGIISNAIINEQSFESIYEQVFASVNISLFVVGIVLFIILGLFSASALLKYSEKMRFNEAFSQEVFINAFKGRFIGALILASVIMIIIQSLLDFIPIVGAAIAAFIAEVFVMTYLGIKYRK
nr:hypothetical protein [Nanoarchaeum sp.]